VAGARTLSGAQAGRARELARYDERLETEPLHLPHVADPPGGSAGATPAVDMRDAAVAQLSEVANGQFRSREVVVRDRVDVGGTDRACHRHRRREPADGEDLVERQPRADQQQSIGPVLEERVDGAAFTGRLAAAGAEQQAVV